MAEPLLLEPTEPNINDAHVDDPIVQILAAFPAIPEEYHSAMFQDFREAADARDLRRLLDTISNWAAMAELYANPRLAAEVQEAINGREGVRDWLHG